MKTSLMQWLSRVPGQLGALGPYLAIELILPGGSLIALLLWLYQRRHHQA
jgi:hypothetical protein